MSSSIAHATYFFGGVLVGAVAMIGIVVRHDIQRKPGRRRGPQPWRALD